MGLILIFAMALLGCRGSKDDHLLVAVTASMVPVIEELVPAVQEACGCPVTIIAATTGGLAAQVREAAPFDVFVAADEQHLLDLARDGFSDFPRPFARGEVVAWAPSMPGLSLEEAIRRSRVIALPNPEHAPYGAAAVAALEREGLLESAKARFVYTANVGQARQCVASGNAELGFVPRPLVRTEREIILLTARSAEAAVTHAVATIVGRKNRNQADCFIGILTGETGKQVLVRHGYAVWTSSTGLD